MEPNKMEAPKIEARSLELVKSEMSLELQRKGFNAIQKQVATMQVTEDNLQEVARFVSDIRALKKTIDQKHKEIKEPYLKACQNIDDAKKQMYKTIDDLASSVEDKYIKICNDIDARKRKADAEKKRIENIRNGIESNLLSFAASISKCNTVKALLGVENLINLEKTRKEKYQEFLGEAIEKFNTLSEAVRKQKKLLLELETIEAKKKSANEEQQVELDQQKEQATKRIDEHSEIIQRETSKSIVDDDLKFTHAEEVLPDVKAKRTTWNFEVLNINKIEKNRPHWLKTIINEEAVKSYMKDRIADGGFGDKEEEVIDGVRFFKVRKF